MRIYRTPELEQRKQEWYDLRVGKMSASEIGNLIGTKSARQKYIYKKAIEILRNPIIEGVDDFSTRSMQRGIDAEPAACETIEMKLGIVKSDIEVIQYSDYFIVSPDFIDQSETIGVEIKTLEPQAMGEALFTDSIADKKHFAQCMSYFLMPTIQTVYYALFIPFEDSISQEPYLCLIRLDREDYEQDILELNVAILEAELEIESLRKKL